MEKINLDLSKRENGFDVFFEIENRLENNVPTSLIRLGDGEGALLGYPTITTRSDVNRLLNIWFGDINYSDSEIKYISNALVDAIGNADVVGLPRQKQISKSHLWRAVIQSEHEFNMISSAAIITDAAIHRYFQFALFYRKLLNKRDYVGLISCRDIREKLSYYFQISDMSLYLVKGEARFPGSDTIRHFPNKFNLIKNDLRVPYKGALFLVGAGPLGKIYCDWIKARGGVAIDIGSIFDAWAGVKSRLVHPCHNMEVYEEKPSISINQAADRYNRLCDFFQLDTQRIDLVLYDKDLIGIW